MKKICIVTGTRAEYGLLKPIIMSLKEQKEFRIQIVVTGAHLSSEFGWTYQEILNDGLKIEKKIETLLASDTAVGISKSMGLAIISFAEYFEEKKPDAVILLGDRTEALSVACAAMNAQIPIIHFYGGETTEGAIDEAIRHSISKMSYFHFTSTEEYRQRVIQLGENPDRVFNVGAVGVENVLKMPLLSKKELEEELKFKLDKPYAVITYHPVTLENNTSVLQVKELLKAIKQQDNMKFIFTKSNADVGSYNINVLFENYVKTHNNAIFVKSLGSKKYLSAIKYSAMVIGNSSSGIIEVPCFKVPTINIGDRQKGRVQAESIINCIADQIEIGKAIKKAQSIEFSLKIQNIDNPYGDGNVCEKVVKILKERFINKKIDLKKQFHNIKN